MSRKITHFFLGSSTRVAFITQDRFHRFYYGMSKTRCKQKRLEKRIADNVLVKLPSPIKVVYAPVLLERNYRGELHLVNPTKHDSEKRMGLWDFSLKRFFQDPAKNFNFS